MQFRHRIPSCMIPGKSRSGIVEPCCCWLTPSLFRNFVLSEPQIIRENIVKLTFQGTHEDLSVRTELSPFPFEIVAHSRVLDLVHLSTVTFQHLKMTQHLAQVSLCSLDLCLAVDLPRLKMLAAGCWLPLAAEKQRHRMGKHLLRAPENSGEVICPTSMVSVISDAATVVARLLKSVLKLSFLEGKLIGVCSLLTSAIRPKKRLPCGVAHGF